MNIRFEITSDELIFAVGGLEESINGLRDFIRETDGRKTIVSHVPRIALKRRKSAHAKMIAALRECGYSMEGDDIIDDPIDEAPQ